MTELIKYDAACRALAEAKAVDEIKDIRDKAEAMRSYGRLAKNKKLEVDAAEIRLRAERRLGLIINEQRTGPGLSPGGSPTHRGPADPGVNGSDNNGLPTLSQVGIDKNLAKRARKLSAPNNREFERMVHDWRSDIEQSNERVTTKLVKQGRSRETQRETAVAHAQRFTRRVKVFLERTKSYLVEVKNARMSITNFSPEARAFVVRRIVTLVNELNKLKEELEQ